MSFGITPPIKSNAASLSFWIFTLIDVNEAADGTNSNRHIYHISLEDFFVVTIIPGKTKYTIYLTAYQMYHEVYGYDIQKIKTKKEFIEIMNKFPYKNEILEGFYLALIILIKRIFPKLIMIILGKNIMDGEKIIRYLKKKMKIKIKKKMKKK